MRRNYKTKETCALKLELENYMGNKELVKFYTTLLNGVAKIDRPSINADLDRAYKSIKFVEKMIGTLPNNEKDFLYDVYMNGKVDISDIMKKYDLTKVGYYRRIDKAIYALSLVYSNVPYIR